MYAETYEEFKSRILGNLRRLLAESRLSQRKQILIGLDPRYIARIKQGKKNITLKTVWKICRAAGFDPVEIFK